MSAHPRSARAAAGEPGEGGGMAPEVAMLIAVALVAAGIVALLIGGAFWLAMLVGWTDTDGWIVFLVGVGFVAPGIVNLALAACLVRRARRRR